MCLCAVLLVSNLAVVYEDWKMGAELESAKTELIGQTENCWTLTNVLIAENHARYEDWKKEHAKVVAMEGK